MNACLKIGGDSTLGAEISIHNFSVTREMVDSLREYLYLGTNQIRVNMLDDGNFFVPNIKCNACGHYYLISEPCTLERLLTETHIYSSLEVDGKIFLICYRCAQKIKWFFENWPILKDVVVSKASAAVEE